jgi:hypothetical protein
MAFISTYLVISDYKIDDMSKEILSREGEAWLLALQALADACIQCTIVLPAWELIAPLI